MVTTRFVVGNEQDLMKRSTHPPGGRMERVMHVNHCWAVAQVRPCGAAAPRRYDFRFFGWLE